MMGHMKITMLGEYAIRAMMHLAENNFGEIVHISAVSQKWKIPESALRKIIPQLRRGGLIRSTRGNSGGISLAKDAHFITPLDIIECVEGEIILNPCLTDAGQCDRTSLCAMHSVWHQARDQLRDTLCGTSLFELVEKERVRIK
jgi:Rrf2 family protein